MMRVTKHFEHLKIQLESIISATNNFADENCVGKGGFGKVYKGELVYSKGQTVVAIKRLNRAFGQGDPEFWKEIIMLSRYKHENIVSLLGFCDDSGEKILVYEYASKKSLDLHLNSNDLTWIQRLKICIGAARGLAYLHDHGTTQQRILHRDIKSSNILLDETWNARISDFGLSKFAPANQQISFMISNGVGTIGYCDPLYVETGLLTKESDVYSFGVVLFEVLCGRLCIGDKNDKRPPLTGLARQCYKQNKLNEIIYGNIKDEINSDSLKAFSTIAYQCLKRDIEERPLMAEVVRVLESALEHQEEEENSKPPVAYTIVEIIEASLMRFVDPYVKGQLGSYTFRTKPQKKTSSPRWLEEFRIPIHTWKSRNVLMIEIWDKNFFIDDIFSNCSITINDFGAGRKHDMWVPLQNGAGELHLRITIVEVEIKLDSQRGRVMVSAAKLIQLRYRTFIARRDSAAKLIQLRYRSFIARRYPQRGVMVSAAKLIQLRYRTFIARRDFTFKRAAAISIQAYCRGHLARIIYAAKQEAAAAILIQKYYRG